MNAFHFQSCSSVCHLICFGLMLVYVSACNSNQTPKGTTALLHPNNCVFDAQLEGMSPEMGSLFQEQIRHFNMNYSIHHATHPSGPSGAATSSFPYPPFFLSKDPAQEPNATKLALLGTDTPCGLYLGFGQPNPEQSRISLYLMLVKDSMVRINQDTCMVVYETIQENQADVCFIYDWESGRWERTSRDVIDRWSSNLFDQAPEQAPAYKGYYIRHQFSHSLYGRDMYMYVGLKDGQPQDTLNVFSMLLPVALMSSISAEGIEISSVDILGDYYLTTSALYSSSVVFSSPDPPGEIHHNHTLIRACPPHCSR